MVEEIRRACGIPAPLAGTGDAEEEADDVAADVKDGTAPADEATDEIEQEFA